MSGLVDHPSMMTSRNRSEFAAIHVPRKQGFWSIYWKFQNWKRGSPKGTAFGLSAPCKSQDTIVIAQMSRSHWPSSERRVASGAEDHASDLHCCTGDTPKRLSWAASSILAFEFGLTFAMLSLATRPSFGCGITEKLFGFEPSNAVLLSEGSFA
jgi:hypothetical protein